MKRQRKGSGEERAEAAIRFVVERLNAGRTRASVIDELTGRGVGQQGAARLVDAVIEEGAHERLTMGSIVPAIAGAVIAAIVGGAVWGVFADVSGREYGALAIGVGALTGLAAVFASGRRKGLVLQVVAVLTALAGILLGKYLIYVAAVRDVLGPSASIGTFDGEVMRAFGEDFTNLLSGFDVLWVGLATFAAWRIPKPLGLRVRRDAGPITI